MTASCHLVECAGSRILVVCGLCPGSRALREEVAEAFRFDPEAIDYLLLTHAQLDHCGRLPRTMQVFLDAPIATSATRIFEHHPECYEAETAELFREGRAPFQLPGLHFTRETADSIALNGIVGGAVILAGSAMCTGGRVLHHLKINVWREDSSVGLAARGSRHAGSADHLQCSERAAVRRKDQGARPYSCDQRLLCPRRPG